MEESKTCLKCRQTKPVGQFGPDRSRSDGLSNWCKDCKREAQAARRAANPLRVVWQNMLARCENPDIPSYKHYGGRGIQVCGAWHDFDAFAAWIKRNLGERPDGMQLDRIDNDGNYEPGNVRWVTQSQNQANARKVSHTTSRFKGVRRTEAGRWAARLRADGRTRRLGTFDDEEAAAHAYDAEAVKTWGEYARLNLPEVTV